MTSDRRLTSRFICSGGFVRAIRVQRSWRKDMQAGASSRELSVGAPGPGCFPRRASARICHCVSASALVCAKIVFSIASSAVCRLAGAGASAFRNR